MPGIASNALKRWVIMPILAYLRQKERFKYAFDLEVFPLKKITCCVTHNVTQQARKETKNKKKNQRGSYDFFLNI